MIKYIYYSFMASIVSNPRHKRILERKARRALIHA